MKRPQRLGYCSDGTPYGMPRYMEIQADYQLLVKVLEWRGIGKCQPKTCDRCGFTSGSRKEFVVHHRHYRTFGSERPEDVCLLCKPCHSELHELAKGFRLTVKDIPFVDPAWEQTIRRKNAGQ